MPPPRAPFNPRFLVVGLGNPDPYTETLHSVGNLALANMIRKMQKGPPELRQPFLSPARFGGKTVQASVGPKYTILQSPTMMNVTGPWLQRVWRDMLRGPSSTSGKEDGAKGPGPSPSELMLVIVHDDLEQKLAECRIRGFESSPRGHNGVKSVLKSIQMQRYPGYRFQRIAVGIGRPQVRDAETVAEYVLRPMTKLERVVLDEYAGVHVLALLEGYEEMWRAHEEREDRRRLGIDTLSEMHSEDTFRRKFDWDGGGNKGNAGGEEEEEPQKYVWEREK